MQQGKRVFEIDAKSSMRDISFLLECPYGYKRSPGNHCFKLKTETKNFHQAKVACENDFPCDPAWSSRLAEPRVGVESNTLMQMMNGL